MADETMSETNPPPGGPDGDPVGAAAGEAFLERDGRRGHASGSVRCGDGCGGNSQGISVFLPMSGMSDMGGFDLASMDILVVAQLAAALLGAGVVAGFLAGLLGVGGGIVVVPVLFHLFVVMGVSAALAMNLAVGTSLAIIIPTAISSTRAHHRHGEVEYARAAALGRRFPRCFGRRRRGRGRRGHGTDRRLRLRSADDRPLSRLFP